MSVIAHQRPGVYSDYNTSGVIWSNGKGKAVGIVALNSAEANVVHKITKAVDAETIFGVEGEMYSLCCMALKNGASEVIAVSAGTSTSCDYEAAFSTLETQNSIYTVVCDSTSPTVHNLLKTSILNCSKNQKERLGIVSFGKYENIDSVKSWAQGLNCERMILLSQIPLDESLKELSGNLLAAALAGVISGNVDPSSSFNTKTLSGIKGISPTLDEDDIDTYITNGITPLECVLDEAEIIRLVTSKTTTDGVLDTTFKDINTVLIIDEVIPGLRDMLKNNLLGGKNNVTTRSAIATQTVIKLQEYKDSGIIVDYQQPNISVSDQDATVCIVEVSFTVSHGLNQIIISANIKV